MPTISYLNRQTPTQLGTGLPFMLDIRYQSRFEEVDSAEPNGYWRCPQNKLPTFQVWRDDDLTKVELIKVVQGVDQAPIEIPIANLIKQCTTGDAKRIYYTTDDERDFILDCGLWYFALEFESGTRPSVYSEIFEVGGVCSYGFSLSYVVTQVNVDLSADVTFTINHKSTQQITAYASTVDAVPFVTKIFSATLTEGVSTPITIEIGTDYCGTFAQDYTFTNTGGVTFALTKTY